VNSAVLRRLAGALLLLLPVLAAAAVPAPAPASASIAFLDSFVGGTWTAPLPPGKAGDTRAIELVFSHTPNHQGIHFESTLLSGARRIPYTSGFYAWNAAKGRFAMFYTDSVGGLVSGDAAVLDNALLHELTETNKDGTVDQIKVRLGLPAGRLGAVHPAAGSASPALNPLDLELLVEARGQLLEEAAG